MTILMALDLEYNQPCNTIIQVGIAIGDTETGEVKYSEQWHVHSEVQVSAYITALTGIVQEDVDGGQSLGYVFAELEHLHEMYGCFMNPLTWGGGDSELLRKQLGLDNASWLFGRRWIDAKTVFVSRQIAKGLPYAGGLRRSMGRLGLKFEGEAHRADVDAVNTFRIYHHLLGEFK